MCIRDSYPSNDAIGQFVMSNDKLFHKIDLRTAPKKAFGEDKLHLNSYAHNIITNDLIKVIK